MVMGDEQYVVGIDIGTSSAKGFVFNSVGKIVAGTEYVYEIICPNPSWKEQKAEWWWESVKKIGHDLTEKVPLSSKNLVGIGITHQRMSVVPVNPYMEPIRNAILWNDTRCVQEVEEVKQKIGVEEVFKMTGVPPGYWTIYKILWLKKNEPELYAKTYKFVLVPDFLTYKLTSNLVTTQSAAALTGALDISHPDSWHSDILAAMGISKDILVDTILPSCMQAGEITAEASVETSFPEGTPVITAAGDQPCGSLGAGLFMENQAAVNGGTSCTCEILVGNLPNRKEPNYYVEISPTGKYILETSIPSGCSALMNWYKNNFGYREIQEAKEKGEDVWSYIYRKAEESPPGNLGMLLVPYFNGICSPYWDLEASGIIIGITLDHGVSNLIRAIMEGLALEVKRDLELLKKSSGNRIKEVLMYGGSSKSDLWNQIFSDVLRVKVCISETSETTALGAAICATVGGGLYKSIDKAVEEMVRKKKEYKPRIKESKMYEELYRRSYKEIYERINELAKNARKICTRAIYDFACVRKPNTVCH
jgi:xylulokinase